MSGESEKKINSIQPKAIKEYLEELDIGISQEIDGPTLPACIIDSTTPLNSPLLGIFKQSSAYFSMRERVPSILNKVIDYLVRESGKISSTYDVSEDEIKVAVKYIKKLIEEILSNKNFTLLKEETAEAEKWNKYIKNAEPLQYFTCIWVFSECYVYRRLQEPFALSRTMKNFDPFGHQKEDAFNDNIEQMCLVADRLSEIVTETDSYKIRQNLVLLLKLGLWSNKQDLSLSMGSAVSSLAVDPIQLVNELNNQILADDSAKAVDAIFANLDNIVTNESNGANRVKPKEVMFDVVCDNAGYEFFMDLCLAYFLLKLKIVDKVRLHVKQIPWYVSDTTPKDVQFVVNGCKTVHFTKELNRLPAKDTGIEVNRLTSSQLNAFGSKCEEYIKDGSIIIQCSENDHGRMALFCYSGYKTMHSVMGPFKYYCDDYWTSPCVYKDMKAIDPELYKKLQQPVAILFKGDLNYRKLLGDRNWIPTTDFEISLEGFHPAPLIAARTVKCKLISGLTPAALERANQSDHDWMETGEFGVIQFSAKCDPRSEEQ